MAQQEVSSSSALQGGNLHHPSWPERWSHPEFTGPLRDLRKRWCKQPWYKHNTRPSVMFIKRLSCLPWGFVIYRTVYTAESDRLWSTCLAKIDRYVHWSIGDIDEDEYPDSDPFPEKFVRETYKNVIFEDRERWEGASLEQIRADFKQYSEFLGMEDGSHIPWSKACLVIDEQCLNSIVSAFEDPEESANWRGPQRGFVIEKGGYIMLKPFVVMVDPTFRPGESYDTPGYQGYMRVEIDDIWEAAVELRLSTVQEMCPNVTPAEMIPVYDGGSGYLVNV
ncbi:hypothetical protein POX_h09379 [Penicillium oxalicum]|uniref:Uncharacterized protein n=2 Tax=Penicillium TaxID=5073 RepID=S8B8J4_PENO1|nr:hypothetical protein POX_h09379 [Penicillium oxalicum]EPS31082.1 hypothetical protein PDE_06036 [Penicillium oxalicum 114-2]KAI2785623.1 hypothetical protein POX_h09379 [Penicillium oxalicum]CEJ61909.1 hypothetical protein PMG11_10425 [Penicillium brasilianum]